MACARAARPELRARRRPSAFERRPSGDYTRQTHVSGPLPSRPVHLLQLRSHGRAGAHRAGLLRVAAPAHARRPRGVLLRAHLRRRHRRLRRGAHLLDRPALERGQQRPLQLPGRRLRPHLVRRPHRWLHRRGGLEPDTQAEGGPRRQRDGTGRGARLRHRASRLPALGRRRLRQADDVVPGDGVPPRHRTDPARRRGLAHADLRDPHHGAGLPRALPDGQEAAAGLVRVRLVPGAVGHRAPSHRVHSPQPRLALRPDRAADPLDRERRHRCRHHRRAAPQAARRSPATGGTSGTEAAREARAPARGWGRKPRSTAASARGPATAGRACPRSAP